MRFDVMFYEAFHEEAESLRRLLPAHCRAGFHTNTVQASGDVIPPAPLISIRTQSVLPPHWLPGVQGLLARTTGYDHLQAYRTQPGLALACLPEYCTRAVAEQAALLWMALLRLLPAQCTQWTTFNRDGLTGGECAGRTLVVAGVGRIGHEVARIGRGLGMQVIGVDVVQRHADITYRAWPEAAPLADVVVACMDLNPGSRHFFRAETLALLKPGALLVNVARGELLDTAAAQDGLASGRLAGLGLDVFNEENRVADALRGLAPGNAESDRLRALARHPGVILTPHNAFNTLEAVERKSQLSVEQVTHFLQHGHFRWPWSPDNAMKS
jgi:D-lactate dehydrogenase